MSKRLIIAEGVEEQEVLQAVSAYGCDEVQGYDFSHPIKARFIAPRIEKTMKWIQ